MEAVCCLGAGNDQCSGGSGLPRLREPHGPITGAALQAGTFATGLQYLETMARWNALKLCAQEGDVVAHGVMASRCLKGIELLKAWEATAHQQQQRPPQRQPATTTGDARGSPINLAAPADQRPNTAQRAGVDQASLLLVQYAPQPAVALMHFDAMILFPALTSLRSSLLLLNMSQPVDIRRAAAIITPARPSRQLQAEEEREAAAEAAKLQGRLEQETQQQQQRQRAEQSSLELARRLAATDERALAQQQQADAAAQPIAPPAGQQQRRQELHTCVAVVPPGQTMRVDVSGQRFNVVVPGGVNPGESFQFNAPKPPPTHCTRACSPPLPEQQHTLCALPPISCSRPPRPAPNNNSTHTHPHTLHLASHFMLCGNSINCAHGASTWTD